MTYLFNQSGRGLILTYINSCSINHQAKNMLVFPVHVGDNLTVPRVNE